MPPDHYDVLVDDILRRCDVVDARRAAGEPTDLVRPTPAPAGRRAGLDFVLVMLVLLLPVSFVHSWMLLGINAAAVVALVVSVYWRAVAWVLEAMGPPDRPRVVAVIQAPERLFCPRCGMERTDAYCPSCGANVEKEYRKMVQQLVRYVVEDTQGQRDYLERAMAVRIRELAEANRTRIDTALAQLERAYVTEIVRQRKLIAAYRRQLPAPERLYRDDEIG